MSRHDSLFKNLKSEFHELPFFPIIHAILGEEPILDDEQNF